MRVLLALCVFLGMCGIFGFFGFLAHPGTFRQAWIHLGERRFFCGCTDTFGHALVLLGTCRYFWAPDFFFCVSGYFWAQGFFCHTQVLLGALLVLTTHIFFGTRDDDDDDYDNSDYGNNDGDDYSNDNGNDDENDDGNDDGNGDGNHNGDDDENDDDNNDDDIWHKKFLEIY